MPDGFAPTPADGLPANSGLSIAGEPAFLALWFPHLSAERLFPFVPTAVTPHSSPTAVTPHSAPAAVTPHSGPAAVTLRDGLARGAAPVAAAIGRVGNALRLASVTPAAARLGLGPGLALADARARVPGLCVADACALADARLLRRLARAMMRFSPVVALDPPDGILLGIAGVSHLFGGAEALAAQAVAVAHAVPLHTVHALAGNAASARALARHGGHAAGQKRDAGAAHRVRGGQNEGGRNGRGQSEAAAVASLPVAALGLSAAAHATLRRAGLLSVGDLASRPRAALAARLGRPAMLALDQLLGRVPVPIVPIAGARPVRAALRPAEPILGNAQAMHLLAGLAARVTRTLERRGAGGRAFAAAFHRADGQRAELLVETSAPLRDSARLMALFEGRIAALDDPLDPGFGYDAITLVVRRMEPMGATAARLDSGAALDAGPLVDGHSARMVDTLAARFGPERLCRPVPIDRHLPECAEDWHPATIGIAGGSPAAAIGPARPPHEPPGRPVLLFHPPQPVDALAEVPDGPPRRFRWQGTTHDVRLAEGPERIAAEWWAHADGRMLPTRDYYRVEDADGRRFWLFRHGLYDRPDGPARPPRWYLHGLFA